jgi:hypothetical protein
MPKEIKIYVKEPGKPLEARKIPNTLEAMQQIVDGYIETFTIATDLVIVCNEEGRLAKSAPYNCTISGGVDFVGTIFFAGKFLDQFCNVRVSKEWIRQIIRHDSADAEDLPTGECCICGRAYTGSGNNPRPVKEDGECCDACNEQYVIPARIRDVMRQKEAAE